MNIVTHFLISWNISAVTAPEKKDRTLITIGGLLPDIDGLGALFEIATRHSEQPLNLYSNYHHQLAHNISAGVLGMLVAMLFAYKRYRTAFIFFLVFHLHLLCDLIGARGPDGYQWPIPYLFPFSPEPQLTWRYQWELVSWQNLVITLVMIFLVFVISYRKKYSPLEIFSARLDRNFVHYLARRFRK